MPEKKLPPSTSQSRPKEAVPQRAGRSQGLSNLVAVYGLLVVFVLVMVVFGLLRPTSFLSTIAA